MRRSFAPPARRGKRRLARLPPALEAGRRPTDRRKAGPSDRALAGAQMVSDTNFRTMRGNGVRHQFCAEMVSDTNFRTLADGGQSLSDARKSVSDTNYRQPSPNR
jgi:hypothetical protein